MQKMDPSSLRTRSARHLSKQQPTQCLCAHVKQIDDLNNGDMEKVDHLANKEADMEHGRFSSCWEAPDSWESHDWWEESIGEIGEEEPERSEPAEKGP